ncbi:MAG: tetratricopeptide repeat protein [Bacteroidales bacterium]|nr:tetratricopeptide repeat protein [Bacteroidales bacterium]
MYQRLFVLMLLISVLITSCQKRKIEPILQQATDIMEEHPDSALAILEAVHNPESFSKSLYYEYSLLQIQAKVKSKKNIFADTLIFDVRDYYKSRGDIENTAIATLYCGKVLQAKNLQDEAIDEYLIGLNYFEGINDNNLKGLYHSSIARVYYNNSLKEKAIKHYKLASQYFHKAVNYKNQISAINYIGNCFLIKGKVDSAFVYYNEAITLADKHKIELLQAALRQGIGVAYREIGEWEKAETSIRNALEYSIDSVNQARLYSELARIFDLQGQKDSAIYYLPKAIGYLPKEKENNLAAHIYKTWTTIEEKDQNYQKALDKYKLYNKHLAQIIDDNKNVAILEIEGKYNFQLLENQNKQLLIERQRILIILILLLLVLSVLVFVLYWRSVQNKRILIDTEKKVRQLTKLARSFDDREESFRNVLIRHFDILKKAAVLEGYLNIEEKKAGKNLLRKFNEVVYGQKQLDWNIVYNTLNLTSNGVLDKIESEFPQLDDSEFRICCLIYLNFNNTEIAILLRYSINTVQAKKSIIRKKLSINTYGNVHDFLKAHIEDRD